MSDDKQNKEYADAINAVREAHEAIEKKAQKFEGGIAELEEKMSKANDALDKMETKNQELIGKLAEERKSAEAQEDAIKELETKVAKLGQIPATAGVEKALALETEIKSLRAFCEGKSEEQMEKSGLEMKYLRSDSNPDGGFLMRDAYDDQIIKPITEISPVRQVARVKTIDALAMEMAARETLVQAYWTGEGEDGTLSQSTYRQPRIPVHSMMVVTEATNTALNGSFWNLETEITGDFVEARQLLEGQAFVNGNGVKKPTGFLQGGLPQLNSGDATTFDFDSLITLTGRLKDGYNPMYALNRRTLAFIRTLKDGADRYIWEAGNVGAAVPNQINGDPYVIMNDMPDIAADAVPVVYADFMKMYCVVDAFNAIFLRNPYIKRGFVEFSVESWVGGQVVLAEAGIELKCAV